MQSAAQAEIPFPIPQCSAPPPLVIFLLEVLHMIQRQIDIIIGYLDIDNPRSWRRCLFLFPVAFANTSKSATA